MAATNTYNNSTTQEPPKDDVAHWIDRFKASMNDTNALMRPSPPQSASWHNRFIDFFQPVDTCLITCCLPAVTFGKTHHRLHHDANLRDYNPVNVSCLGFCFGCCGINLFMSVLQRREIRERFHLEGDCVQDCLRSFCCICCTLVQADKEAEYQLLHNNGVAMTQPSAKKEEMTYTAPYSDTTASAAPVTTADPTIAPVVAPEPTNNGVHKA